MGVSADTQNLESILAFGFTKKFIKSSISLNAYYVDKDEREVSSDTFNATSFQDYIALIPTSRGSRLPASFSVGEISSYSELQLALDGVQNNPELKAALNKVAQVASGRELNIIDSSYIFTVKYTYSF